jgi:DNA invertase Pin-like site-specific DNA recombinase
MLTLLDSGVDVLFCDMPGISGAMGRFMLTTMASTAEPEAGLVSERTKAALAAAKRRGTQLGVNGREVLAPKYKAEAQARAKELAPIIRELRRQGLSLNEMAAELNRRNITTPLGGDWHPQTVKRVVQRLDKRRGSNP